MLLTIGMMVKNEEKHLEECLEALTPIREALDSELVIVDTGSTDNTVKIAKQFTEKVYFHEWNDNFSEMRNTVISYAKGDWYFSLDGDEVINNPEGFIDFFKSGKYKKYNTALVIQKNYNDIEKNLFALDAVPRVFKNENNFHFEGAIHNQPQYKKPIYELNTILDHYGYISNDNELMEEKFKRTSAILKKELEKNPQNIYYWFQLSRSYTMHGDLKDALEAIRTAYEIVKKQENYQKYISVFIQLTKIYYMIEKYKKVEEIAKKAIDIKDGYLDIYYYLAESQYYLNKKRKSLQNFKKYIELVNNYYDINTKKDITVSNETISSSDFAYKYIIYLCSELEQDYDYALNSALNINDEVQLKVIIKPFINICFKSGNHNYLKRFFIKKTKDKEELRFQFLSVLENKRDKLDTEVENEIIKIFSSVDDNDEYILLNKIRRDIINSKITQANVHVEKLDEINFDEKPGFYGDIIYYILNQDKSEIYNFLSSIKENNLNKFIEYINEKYNDLAQLLFKILDDNNPDDIQKLRIKKSFGRYLIALDDITIDSDYVIDKYLESGIKYIRRLYNKEIIENELTTELKSKEEAFLLFIYKAFDLKDSDLKVYIKYLRKALDIYPSMKKVVEALLMEIKEDQDKINQELEVEKNKFKANIEELINQGKLNEAESLIGEYQNNFEPDDEIYSMLGIIAINKGQNKGAKNLFKKGLEIKHNNADLLYNLAFIDESEENYLAALENYEKSIFNMEDSPDRKELIKYINDFENKHKDIIQKQLEEREETGINYIENPKYKFVHLMYDNFYCNKFMHFTNEHFDEKDHLYLMVVPENHEFEYIDFDGLDNVKVINLKNDIKKLNYYLNNTNKIFIHYLFDHICRVLTKLDIKKEFYWSLYGGDLYNYIKKELHSPKTKKFMEKIGFKFNNNLSIDMIYRKSIIRKLNYVLTSKTGDFDILKNYFLTDAKRYNLIHPLPLDFDDLNKSKSLLPERYQLKNRFKRVILVGNSANSSNNHIDILYNLKKIDSNNFCIVMPLSYSGHDRYINELIKVGKKLFGDRFIPIEEYLDKEIYSQLLNQVDVAIFNHKRQQALANIIALLYLGKKVYIRKNISSFDFLNNKGVEVFEIDNLKSDIVKNKLYEIDKSTIKNNRDKIIEYFNYNTRLKYMKKIFV